MWVSQKHIAGYSQQDAHEFFISLLDELHKTSHGTMSRCKCIIHRTFGGQLQSDLVCLNCGHTSFALDPFLDLSLEIKSSTKLSDCLDEYTQPERLKYACKNCKHPEATKQLSLKRLPPVLAIQLKVSHTHCRHMSTWLRPPRLNIASRYPISWT
jgi:ubiquitin carboxyl-terminal hydrolase 22/27/51